MALGPDLSFKAFLQRLSAAAVSGKGRPSELALGASRMAPDVKRHLLDVYGGMQVVESVELANGQIFDCIPIEAQPAARLFERPPEPPVPDDPTPAFRSLLAAAAESIPRCPDGTVPLLRPSLTDASRHGDLQSFLGRGRKRKPPTGQGERATDLLDLVGTPHRYATAFQRIANHGGRASVNLWKPALSAGQIMSLSQIWCSAGVSPGAVLQTVEAGWQVCPANFPYASGDPVFFIYWTADDYSTTGAYNNLDNKFYVKSKAFPIGGIFNVTSIAGGAQYDIDVSYRYADGDWWLYIGGVAIGAWAKALFGAGAMSLGCEEVMFGGETAGGTSFPPMGSGAAPATGYGHAAYQRDLVYWNTADDPVAVALQKLEPTPASYTISLDRPDAPAGQAWGRYFYFGGPGGN